MVLIESGRTKTALLYTNFNGERTEMAFDGISAFSPVNHQTKVLEELAATVQKNRAAGPVYWYLSGYFRRNPELESLARQYFTGGVVIENDVLGACRALLNNQGGSVGILGSGCNFVKYTGIKVKPLYQSLGYWLADQGSGFGIAKQLIEDYFRLQMPESLANKFSELLRKDRFELVQDFQSGAIDKVFQQLPLFCSSNRTDEYIQKVLRLQFETYLSYVRRLDPEVTHLHLVGSIAFIFQKELEQAAVPVGIQIGRVLKGPSTALFDYHEQRT